MRKSANVSVGSDSTARVAGRCDGTESSNGARLAIDVAGLTISFGAGEAGLVIDDITLSVALGEFVAIVGPSGCGKTTFLNVLSGLEPVPSGTVRVDGVDPAPGKPEVGYLFARDALLPWRTALGNVELPLLLRGMAKRDRHQRALEALSDVGLSGAADAWRSELSQGMRQRVAIARTLATEPRIIFMDEPFSALDAQTRLSVQDRFLKLWQRTNATVVLITHDLHEAVALADRVVVFTKRPARIKSIHSVAIPRPRSLVSLQADDRFHSAYAAIWQQIRDEVASAEDSQA